MGSAAGTQSGSRRLCLWSGFHLSRQPLLRCVQHHTIDGRLPCSQSSTRGCSLPRLCHQWGGGCSAARLGAYHSRRTRRLLKQPPMQPGNTTSPCCCISFHREHFHRGTRVSQERLAFKAVGVGLPRGALHSASQQGCRSLKNGRSLPPAGLQH